MANHRQDKARGRAQDKKNGKQRKISIKTKMYLSLWLVFALAFSVAVILKFNQLQTFEQEKQEITAQIEQQKATNNSLRRELEYYGTDAYVERAAREELGLVSPNETVFYNSTN